MTAAKLEPALVPEPLWELSGRGLLPRSRWEAIRRAVIAESPPDCSTCGAAMSPPICHEHWSYDDESHVATLMGLGLICRACNGVHHFGQAMRDGWGEEVVAHLQGVNRVDADGALALLGRAMDEWRERSRHRWTIAVDPSVAARFSELAVLDGMEGAPGDGTRRRATRRSS